MTLACDYCGNDAVWYVSTPVPAPPRIRSRFSCGRHVDQARAVVGDGGRPVNVTPINGTTDQEGSTA